MEKNDRIHHFRGAAYEIGLAVGRALGAKVEQTINYYIAAREHACDMTKLRQGALPWLRRLPQRFQEELGRDGGGRQASVAAARRVVLH